jgi:ABC-type antimicrobial peptide transport system permease subunit
VAVPGSVPLEERAALFGALVERLRGEPFVEAASASGGEVVSFAAARELHVFDSPVARLQAGLAAGLAAVAVVLALIGLYGLMGYVVGRRERETGIRAALGATPASIVRLMLRHAERLTGTGLLLGLLLSTMATGGLAGLLYETEPRDPLTLASAAVVLGLAAMLAACGPARRAARVDPASVLRAE